MIKKMFLGILGLALCADLFAPNYFDFLEDGSIIKNIEHSISTSSNLSGFFDGPRRRACDRLNKIFAQEALGNTSVYSRFRHNWLRLFYSESDINALDLHAKKQAINACINDILQELVADPDIFSTEFDHTVKVLEKIKEQRKLLDFDTKNQNRR